MTPTSGDGYVTLPNGGTRWGQFGAAGLLLRNVDAGVERFLLVLRNRHTHGGECWGIPGGALNFQEGPVDGALREFREEFNHRPTLTDVIGAHVDDSGGWTYSTTIAGAAYPTEVVPCSWEHDDARWVTRAEAADLPLHPALAAALPALYAIVDEWETP